MNKKAIATVLTMILLMSVSAWAQPGGSAAAAQVLSAAAGAHGGAAALAGWKDASASGTMSFARAGGAVEDCRITVRSRGLTMVRSDLSCPLTGSTVYVSDGQWGWGLRDGRKQALPLLDTANRPLEVNPALGALGLFAAGRLQTVSVDAAEQGRILVVSGLIGGGADPEGGQLQARPVEIDVDAETHLVDRVRIWEFGRDGRLLPEPEELILSDWRRAAGLMVPFRVETVRYGILVSILQLDTFSKATHASGLFVEP